MIFPFNHFIIFLLLLIASTGYSQADNDYEQYSDSLKKIGKEDLLVPYFQKETKSKPKNEFARKWLGHSYFEKGEYENAEKAYREALIINPSCAKCYLGIAKVYGVKNEVDKAMENVDKGIAIDPKEAALYSVRASLKDMKGDRFGAFFDHNRAIELAPGKYLYYLQRGLHHLGHGNTMLALSDFNKATELDPDAYFPYYQRASLYHASGQFQEALTEMNAAVERDSSDASLFLGRGAVYAAMNLQEKAIADYTKSIALNPEDFTAYYNRSLCRYALEDMDGSCTDLNTGYAVMKKNDPENEMKAEFEYSMENYCNDSKPSYYYQRGVALYNMGRFQDAVNIYTQGLSKFKTNSVMLSFRGNAFLMLNEFDRATEDYFNALLHVDNAPADLMANIQRLKITEDQIPEYTKVYIADIHLSMGRAYLGSGRYMEALMEMNTAKEQVLTTDYFDKEYFFHDRGNALLGLKEYADAKSDFDESIRLRASFDLAYVNRAIAKAYLATSGNITRGIPRARFEGKELMMNWKIPGNMGKADLAPAIADCNYAIKLKKDNAYAYFIRAWLKKENGDPDYCADFLKAKELGITLDTEFEVLCK